MQHHARPTHSTQESEVLRSGNLSRREALSATLGATLGAGVIAGVGLGASSSHAKAAASGLAFQQPASTTASTATIESPATTKQRTLRKAVTMGMIGEGKTLEEKFKVAKEAGFAGIEMDSPSDIVATDALAAAEKVGVSLHGAVNSQHWRIPLNAPDPVARAKAREAIETCLRDAHAYKATSILLVPAVVSAKNPYDAAYTLSQEEIRKVLGLAAELKVKIAIENVWNQFLLSPLEAARYVDEFESPWVTFHFDIGNVINFGYPDQWIRVLGHRISKLHIKDFSRKKRDAEGLWKGFDVQLGEGDANWPAVMAALDEIGYSTAPEGNWATAEVGGGDSKRLRQVSDQMDALFRM